MDFRALQEAMPWTDIWTDGFLNDPRPYSKFQHCLMNVMGKLGAVAQRVELSDHHGQEYELGMDRKKDGKAMAFIIMSIMKAANVYPGGKIDLMQYIEADLRRRDDQ